MADPLLTSLCSICHVSTPKYKCPRCSVRTCSLGCIKKHKAWAECSGERDPTTYIPPSKLRTAAGVDHDYNFLHGIEMSLERNEKVLVGEKSLVQAEELRPLTVEEVKWKTGRDGKKRKVLMTRVLKEAKGRVFERFLAQKLKKYNVAIMCAPLGMSRQKENKTTLNRKTGRINWQVEWMQAHTPKQQATRHLSKVMDDVPLFEAYRALLEEQQGNQGTGNATKATAKNTRPGSCHQDPKTSTWFLYDGSAVDFWPQETKDDYEFYLAKPQTRSDMPVSLTLLASGACFRDILTNTRVLEFPTVYVLSKGQALPDGFILGPKDTVPVQGTKRKEDTGSNKDLRGAKRRKQDQNREDGEVGSGGDSQDDDKDEKGSHAQGTTMGLEAGDVIAEQSLGEEEEVDEDDETSSSGSDSESD